MPETSQASTVSFRGQVIGELLSVSVSPARAEISQYPGWGVGYATPDGRRKYKPLNFCQIVRPGGCQITFLGSGGLSSSMIGSRGELEVSLSDGGHGFSLTAILETYEITASVGELLRGSASFVFTGGL